ncbi:elongation factor P hydroxylase [Pasteurella skyensis]|uniref:Elongation factor P hydroxylase n=1 Tax=Phocoenobacter skyensis TaxID=97481 RepID=A0AAJ6NB32_9PAST|nr:elongation factor P hydroxylase [Pasteurella skyensis]MDP8163072.1 elongation factor P hydroxylase [Pasteurella skyensis]MDP8173548.1 elongation factor P hydroxylase [Pasteurella skyensis]MDP8178999.1 elongation factor P hydroxylase [Pasteurella skyensis]MDP8183769.1 elongation factor P hydroxylase [Pasteurella skyensis]MDP8189713.1 elongation factor P hydroxylase [Pasteurella skyensis]
MHQDNHKVEDLIQIFNDTFFNTYNVKLDFGTDYPIYLPQFLDEGGIPCERNYNVILFSNGYYSSALHEISHWLVAGKERHKLEDFGYWYEPDGRNEQQQREFEKFEVKPQALEWILATAANFRYFASTDNLTGNTGDTTPFKQAVYNQVKLYAKQGLPQRAEQLRHALSQFYSTPDYIDLTRFDISKI